jgi:hypothetical protein
VLAVECQVSFGSTNNLHIAPNVLCELWALRHGCVDVWVVLEPEECGVSRADPHDPLTPRPDKAVDQQGLGRAHQRLSAPQHTSSRPTFKGLIETGRAAATRRKQFLQRASNGCTSTWLNTNKGGIGAGICTAQVVAGHGAWRSVRQKVAEGTFCCAHCLCCRAEGCAVGSTYGIRHTTDRWTNTRISTAN